MNSEKENYEDKMDRLIVAGDSNARTGVEQEVAACGTQLEIKIQNNSKERQKIQERMKWNERKAEKYVETWWGSWQERRKKEQEN